MMPRLSSFSGSSRTIRAPLCALITFSMASLSSVPGATSSRALASSAGKCRRRGLTATPPPRLPRGCLLPRRSPPYGARRPHHRHLGGPTRRTGVVAQVTREPDLSETGGTLAHGLVPHRRSDGERHTEVGRGLLDPHTAGDVDVDVLILEREARPPAQHRAEHVGPPRVHPVGYPPWVGQRARRDEALYLDEHGARPLQKADRHDSRRHLFLPLREEERGRVLDLDHPASRHLEDPDLVRRPETVLERPQNPEALEPVSLELEHRVDHVLEDARTRYRALFRNMSYKNDRYALAFGDSHEPRRALANLPDSAGRPRELGRVERLDRIHHNGPRPLFEDRRLYDVHVRLGENPEAPSFDPEPAGVQGHLPRRLLAGDHEAAFSQVSHDLQQKRALADAGFSPDKDHRAGHDPAS